MKPAEDGYTLPELIITLVVGLVVTMATISIILLIKHW